jgi:cupin 2 domain-containing protein
MKLAQHNLFASVRSEAAVEEVTELMRSDHARIERIVSTGQASPAGFWYNQEWDEWVLLVAGSAGLRIEGEEQVRLLGPGDYVAIPAHVRHRVEWTAASEPTVWLTVHCPPVTAE